MKSPSAICLDDISKFYKLYQSPKDRLKESLHPFGKTYHTPFFALKNINLEIKQGEILGIVGKNGAGKTTLLKIISGLLQPSLGKLSINGNITSLLGVGSGLSPKLTGIQNIVFNAALLDYEKVKTQEYIQKITDFAEIGDYIHQPVKTYSSGMKSRLGFAMAANVDPEILVVDEVLAVGDALFKRKCFAKMESLFKADKTIIYVSHSANAIRELCTRAILIDAGELILDDSPKSVTEQYERYLFSKPNVVKTVRNEIIQMCKYKTVPRASTTKPPQKSSDGEKIQFYDSDNTSKKVEEIEFKPYLIKNMVSRSAMEYKQYDVDIYDMQIQTVEGKRVNALVTGEEYIYSFKVRFRVPAENVSFGSRFKTVKGLVFSGKGTQGKIDRVSAQDQYFVECSFRCNLMKGVYYIDTGVSGRINGEIVMLNRIVDAMVFKVQNSLSKKSYGLVYLGQDFRVCKK